MTRRQYRFYHLLLLFFSWYAPGVSAQYFEPVTPVEVIVHQVSDGVAQTAQFADLQTLAAQTVLAQDVTQFLDRSDTALIFDATFAVDGHHGELKNKLILEDWEEMAAGMGTTGAVLAGAYVVWRRRRQDELDRLRAGDGSMITDVFKNFDTDEAAISGSWDTWAAQNNLAGAGGTLSQLWGLFQRKQKLEQDQFEHEDWLQTTYASFKKPIGKNDFRTAVIREIHYRQKKEIDLADQEHQKSAPIPPATPESLQELKDLKKIIKEGLDLTALGVPSDQVKNYKSGLQNQVLYLTRENQQSGDVIAGAIIKSLESLQQSVAAMLQQAPEMQGITRVSSLQSTHRSIAQLARNWWSKNHQKITDKDLKAKFYPLATASVYNKEISYNQAIEDNETYLVAQEKYQAKKRVWDQEREAIRLKISRRYSSVSSEINSYWYNRAQLNQNNETWNEQLKDFSEKAHLGKKALEKTQKQSFFDDFLAQMSGKSSTVAVDQFVSWCERAPTTDKNLIESQSDTVLQSDKALSDLDKLLSMTSKWSEKDQIRRKIEEMNAKKTTALETIWLVREKWLSGAENQSQIALKIQHSVAMPKLECDEVSQWLKEQELNQEFYRKYGIMDRTAYLRSEISRLEEMADKMQKNGLDKTNKMMRPFNGKTAPYGLGEYYGHQWVRFSDVTRDLEILRKGQLPWQHWSPSYQVGRYYFGHDLPPIGDDELRALYYRYANSPDQASRNKWKKEIETVETALYATRNQQWQSAQTQTLETQFTATQIADYKTLKSEVECCGTKIKNLEQETAETQQNFVEQVQITNRIASTPKELTKLRAFDSADMINLAKEVNKTALSESIEKILWEAFRRYPQSFDDFSFEAGRLIEQTKKNRRNDLIAKLRIPPAPVMTKTVRDYLENPERTSADIDREITKVRSSFPELQAKYAGKPYLTTALFQANAKIKALERYKASGPVAATQYKAEIAKYETTYASALAQIDQQVAVEHDNWQEYTVAYFDRAGTLLAKEETTEEHVPTDPADVELVEVAPEFVFGEIERTLEQSQKAPLGFSPAREATQIIFSATTETIKQETTCDETSNQRIARLNPLVGQKATALIKAVQAELGINLRVTSGLRTHEEQDRLYQQSRTTPGPVVTHAQAGFSYHNYGQAVDFVGMNADGTINYDLDWEAIGTIGERLGFTWGGRWEFSDKAHFQMELGKTVGQLREMNLLGGVYYDPRRFESSLQAGGYDENHELATDPQWIETQIDFIKSGEVDFLSFLNHSKDEKIALLEAAKVEHSHWKVFSRPNKNLGDFIGEVEKYLGRVSLAEKFIKIAQLASALQSPLTNIPAIIKFLSQDGVYEKVEDLLELHEEFANKIVQTAEEAQILAADFHARLSDLMSTFVGVPNATNEAFEYLHFEYRASLNVDLPHHEEIENNLVNDWVKVSDFEAKYHQDYSNNFLELKYINKDGREVVYTYNELLKSYEIENRPSIAGTYNFVAPIPFGHVSPLNYKPYIAKGLGHAVLDILPHKIYNGSIR